MEGLLFYSDLFASWIDNLSRFWGFLNTNVIATLDSAINTISGNGNSPAIALIESLKLVFYAFGFGDLTVLGFMFSIMGYAFGIYFAIMIIRWVLDILP